MRAVVGQGHWLAPVGGVSLLKIGGEGGGSVEEAGSGGAGNIVHPKELPQPRLHNVGSFHRTTIQISLETPQ